MFDLPELDDVICSHLGQHDLVQCAQVSKKWHTIVIPHLWRAFQWTSVDRSKEAYRRIVLEDYHYEQERRQLHKEEGSSSEQPDQTTLELHTLSTFTKYAHYIQTLPTPLNLYSFLGQGQQETETCEEKTLGLLRHVYSRCLGLQEPFLHLDHRIIQSDNLLKTITECAIPHVSHLSFSSDGFSQSKALKFVLDHCSNKLEALNLSVDIAQEDESDEMEAPDQDQVSRTNAHFKVLRLFQCADRSTSKLFWSWLWKRCDQVKALEIREVSGIIMGLTKAMQDNMPNLNAIRITTNVWTRRNYTDTVIASILSSCRQGWKQVTLVSLRMIGKGSMAALEKHFSTLESLVINLQDNPECQDLVRVLADCPRLHTFSDIDEESTFRDHFHYFDADTFIDRNICSGALLPWKCETSLRCLGVKITGIPRPDLKGERVVKESYPGQGREMQSLVYDRLARLINLERLCLGDSALFHDGFLDCLEMSLESGLRKLAGLKQLKELDVGGMSVRIGRLEVQWMVEHWPKLRCIFGLTDEALMWLRVHRPDIKWNETLNP